MLQINLTESALQDLHDIKNWYVSEHAAAVGMSIIEKILDRIEPLSEFPELGRIVPEFNQQHLREFIQKPYRIVYLLEPGQIRIIRIWHSKRLMEHPP